jgi:hypothetical protein
MPDLQIPQRQTYPAIRGAVSDEQGLLPLATAQSIDLVLNGPGGTPVVHLPVVALDPPQQFMVAGTTFMANWEAPLVGATTAVATEVLYRGKLKITWQTVPLMQQFAPQVDFIEIEIVENVVEA